MDEIFFYLIIIIYENNWNTCNSKNDIFNLLSHGMVFIYLKTLETLGWHDIQTDNLNNNNNDDNVNVAAANNTQ